MVFSCSGLSWGSKHLVGGLVCSQQHWSVRVARDDLRRGLRLGGSEGAGLLETRDVVGAQTKLVGQDGVAMLTEPGHPWFLRRPLEPRCVPGQRKRSAESIVDFPQRVTAAQVFVVDHF